MMRGKSSVYGRVSESGSMSAQTTSASSAADEVAACEVRPGGMLVQKRTDQPENLGKLLRIRVAYGKLRYEISVNSQSTFGELKKLLVRDTGLQPGEQQLIFKGKERENGAYLDMCGVKERSKVELLEDPLCRERRIVESRKSAKLQFAQRALADISAEVDRLAGQGKRVQKSVETLDLLKVENANVKPVIISTKWETFEFDPPPSTAACWELFD